MTTAPQFIAAVVGVEIGQATASRTTSNNLSVIGIRDKGIRVSTGIRCFSSQQLSEALAKTGASVSASTTYLLSVSP